MQQQGAVGQVEAGLGQAESRQILQIGALNAQTLGLMGAGLRQHARRHIQAQHRGRALLMGPAAEGAEAAAQVQHPQAGQGRQQGAQGRPFQHRVQALDGTSQLAVAGEKAGIVVDVLRARTHGVRRC